MGLAARTVARTVGRLALRLLARSVEELWAAAMAMWAQLSEQAHALLPDWSVFYSLSFFCFLGVFGVFLPVGARVCMFFWAFNAALILWKSVDCIACVYRVQIFLT